ncbi:hypothetical protein [Asticcacaulis sp. 201]|uniref:hypothetical protein n=1 Tax=Asticcacaulis sp. 201 TaxID=3028787 RepID=UPI0029166A24|nr:hypothetical protein [Asticcacaulis sp. 201]MDV6331460.1 hypothetical protein [Asticcacaulis sp. 201]
MRRVARLMFAGVIALMPVALAGCGFVPLYAQQGLTANMAQIGIEMPQTRTGYFLEQNLRNGFGSDDKSQKRYKLTVKMTEKRYGVGFRVDDTSTRSELTSSITYVLTDATTHAVMYQNSFVETVSYDTSPSPLTGVIAQQDAQERVASAISRKIQTELAVYFHEKK